jgi:hypothetical protein
MNIESTTPALACADRSTVYTLARQISIAGNLRGMYTVMDILLDAAYGSTRSRGMTLTNSIG